MTAAALLWLLPALALLLFAACWWGSNIILHPPKMLPNVVFPEQFGLPHEKVSFRTGDGLTLRGWMIPASSPTPRTLFLCHGWGDNKGDILRRFHFLADRYNLFCFDSRGHGESDGTYTTIGHLETIDFETALRFLRETRPAWSERLGLVGLSMGAAMGIHGMARHPDFRCAVLESPFRSFDRVVHQFVETHYHLPHIPFTWLTLRILRLRLGADPEPSSPIYHIEKASGRPLLFIAGELDALMPLAEVRALHAAARDPKSLWVVPGAGHGACQETAGEEYARRIREFFDAHL